MRHPILVALTLAGVLWPASAWGEEKTFSFFEYLTGRQPALVAFNPTDYDPRPGQKRLPSLASLQADLAALRPAFDGLILYAFDAELTPVILAEAKKLRYRAVLLGIYTLSDEELRGTAALIKRHRQEFALAVVIGNEGLNFNRYSQDDLTAAHRKLRELLGSEAAVPLTTSEPWAQYGQAFVQDFGDFLCPNIHPAFDRPDYSPERAAEWARSRAKTLATAVGKPVLLKETGLPHAGHARWTPAAQRAFWQAYLRCGRLKTISDEPHVFVSFAAAFEGFDLPWKAAETGMAIEGAWGLMNHQRQAYPAFAVWNRTSRTVAPAAQPDADERAYNHLVAEMDRWLGTVVYDDYASGGARFYPTNWQGDIADIELDERCLDHVDEGHGSTVRITYTPKAPKRWVGVTWAYPDRPGPNWGEAPGLQLTGARELSGKIRGMRGGEAVELSIGGVNRPLNQNVGDHHDEFGPVRKVIKLTRDWQNFTLVMPPNIARRNPLKVIGGFTCAISADANDPDGCTIYLDDIRYDDRRHDEFRLIRSYTPTVCRGDDPIRNAAFLYDNCLALLAFLARGDADSLRRADILAKSLAWAQRHDRAGNKLNDAVPWRNAYACGPLKDEASNTARLPGTYDAANRRMLEDRYAVSSDTGNQAWAIIALLAAHRRLEAGNRVDYRYLKAALAAAKWIEENCRVDDKFGGYSGGLEGWEKTEDNPQGPAKLQWRSTEHAIDLAVAFWQLAAALEGAKRVDAEQWTNRDDGLWTQRAEHARKFVLSMWNPDGLFFWTGVRNEQRTINDDAVPLDVQTWSLLALGHDAEFRRKIGWVGPPEVPSMLRWVEEHCRAGHATELEGYRFSNRGKGIWPEGGGQMAACYHYLDLPDRAGVIRATLARFQDEATGGLLAAFPDAAETGFLKDFGPDEHGAPVVLKWKYPRRAHIGATAWYLLSRGNPYWIDGAPAR